MALSFCSVTSWVLPVETSFPIYSFGQQTWNTTAIFAVWRQIDLLYPFIKHFHMYFTILGGVRL